MSPLKQIILYIDCLFSKQEKTYEEYRSGFKKIENFYNENRFDSDFEFNSYLLKPLDSYFKNGSKLFKYKHKHHSDELNEFIQLSKSTVIFWNDTFEDFEIIINGPIIFCKKFHYLRKIMKTLFNLREISSRSFIFENEDGFIQIESMQMLYCVIFSDEELIKKLPDCEYCCFQFIFKDFLDILPNIRPSNTAKINFLISKLFDFASDEMTRFLSRHKKIAKMYMKQNPETGENFFIL